MSSPPQGRDSFLNSEDKPTCDGIHGQLPLTFTSLLGPERHVGPPTPAKTLVEESLLTSEGFICCYRGRGPVSSKAEIPL